MSRQSFFERRNARLIPLLLTILPVAAAAGIDLPLGGWRQGDADAPYTQEVNYPASRPGLDAGASRAAQIRGRIDHHAKQPATLVVNGSAMPLEVDENGFFGRPYSFATGSNSVEVISPGQKPQRVQFYQTAAGQAEARMRVILSWDTPGSDLDLHVITPSGEHAWYGQRAIRSGTIDMDVTTGYGPEIFASPAPEKGLYQIYLNYYGGGRGQALTIATIAIVSNEGTPDEKRQEFRVPMRFSGELTLVHQFVYP